MRMNKAVKISGRRSRHINRWATCATSPSRSTARPIRRRSSFSRRWNTSIARWNYGGRSGTYAAKFSRSRPSAKFTIASGAPKRRSNTCVSFARPLLHSQWLEDPNQSAHQTRLGESDFAPVGRVPRLLRTGAAHLPIYPRPRERIPDALRAGASGDGGGVLTRRDVTSRAR